MAVCLSPLFFGIEKIAKGKMEEYSAIWSIIIPVGKIVRNILQNFALMKQGEIGSIVKKTCFEKRVLL